jgi:hypothetical protein
VKRPGILLAVCALCCAAVSAPAVPGRPDVHQDAPRLTWLTPGFLPPDGLLTAGLGGSFYPTEYDPTGSPFEYNVLRVRLSGDWTPLPGVALSARQHLKAWSNYLPNTAWETAGTAASGFGLADGDWRLAVAMPWLPSWVGVVGWGGSNLPVGADGLGEGALSPELGATLSLRVWRQGNLPEMRLHASYGRRWNRNEDDGYGVHQGVGPQPWYPQYPDAASSGGDANNDFRFWGAAVEFRAGTTALWVEYSEQQLWRAEQVWPREDHKILAAGARWGLEEGWALHVDYQVSFAKDEPWFTDFYPASPELAYTLGVTRQFGIGGRDGDRDGVPDRRDQCPDAPEDRDGYQDDDGCPDLDNDGDGIPDHRDLAPDEPEDFDGWADLDGMPDPDNDGDGIPDRLDACPDEAEDFDGFRDQDGCPEEFLDTDGDLIPDDEDLCPNSAEDRDGFQDADGCPDPDNDLDGIDDVDDECPDEPEDYDGDRDHDGCPDGPAEEDGAVEAGGEAVEDAAGEAVDEAGREAGREAGGVGTGTATGTATGAAAERDAGKPAGGSAGGGAGGGADGGGDGGGAADGGDGADDGGGDGAADGGGDGDDDGADDGEGAGDGADSLAPAL